MTANEDGAISPLQPHPNGLELELGSVSMEMIRQRIIHTLSIYPRLSNSMLQVGIGTGIPPRLWHPVLEKLVNDGVIQRRVVKAVNPVTQREQVYTLLGIETDAAA